MTKLVYPNYQNSLLNVSSSFFKYYNLETKYPSLPILDKYLEKQYKHIVVFLVDAMGEAIINKNLPDNSFLKENIKTTITSVSPSTTSAATTAFLSGKSPLETGWFAWQQYFQEYGRHIILFLNEDYYTKEKLDVNILQNELKHENIFDKFRQYRPEIQAKTTIFENKKQKFLPLRKLIRFAKKEIKSEKETWTYCYYPELDSLMHQVGTSHKKVQRLMKKINRCLERFSRKKKDDTLVVVLADHGQIDTEEINLINHPDLIKTLTLKPSFEGRFASFNVIDEESFIKYYQQHFQDDFVLKTKEEIFKENFFGLEGKTEFERFLGNYFLIAKGKYILNYHELDKPSTKSGHHAGLTSDEMNISLIIF